MARKKSIETILKNYECEGQMEFKESDLMTEEIPFTDDVVDVCNGCMKEDCVGCVWSSPDMVEYERERLNCLQDAKEVF